MKYMFILLLIACGGPGAEPEPDSGLPEAGQKCAEAEAGKSYCVANRSLLCGKTVCAHPEPNGPRITVTEHLGELTWIDCGPGCGP